MNSSGCRKLFRSRKPQGQSCVSSLAGESLPNTRAVWIWSRLPIVQSRRFCRAVADGLSCARIFGAEGARDRLDSEFRWYIDPLDGTTNFAHGFPVFCVSMGLEHRPTGLAAEHDGPIMAAVTYDPMRDELFVAERGRGAFLNDRPSMCRLCRS